MSTATRSPRQPRYNAAAALVRITERYSEEEGGAGRELGKNKMVAHGGGNNPSSPPPLLMSLAAGGIAGGVEAACTYPFEFAKTRVQLYGHERGASRNPFAVVARAAREEGARALYRGCSAMVVGSAAKDAVRFVAFDAIRGALLERGRATGEDGEGGTGGGGGGGGEPETLGPARSVAAGMAAGVVASTLAVTPSERVKTALIDDARTERRFRGAWDCVATLTREQGWRRALWRGYVTTYVSSFPRFPPPLFAFIHLLSPYLLSCRGEGCRSPCINNCTATRFLLPISSQLPPQKNNGSPRGIRLASRCCPPIY